MRGLYAITPEGLAEADMLARSAEIVAAGAQLLQYRDKSDDRGGRLRQATHLRQLCADSGCRFIINDDIELAAAVAADGVHLGRDDQRLGSARQRLGPGATIGISCYNQLERARQAEEEGADYLAFGAFYPSRVKPGARVAEPSLLNRSRTGLSLPQCAIGGITAERAPELVAAGADLLAVITALYDAPDSGRAAAEFVRCFC